MSAIDYAINQLTYTVNSTLLEMFFPKNNQFDLRTLDKRLIEAVIDRRVRRDVDTFGGTTAIIPVEKCQKFSHTDGSMVLIVEEELLGGLDIAWPVSLRFHSGIARPSNGLAGGHGGMDGETRELIRMMNGNYTEVVADASLSMLDRRTVWCRDVNSASASAMLEVVLTNSRDFSNLQLASHRKFAELVCWAAKSYMYAHRSEFINRQRYLGIDSSIVESEVSDFSTAEEEYQQSLKAWGTISVFNDDSRRRKFIKARIPT